MNAIHIFSVPFTGLGIQNGFRGNKWLKRRIQVFKNFVLPSLIHQTKKEFIVWIQWRKQEEYNPIVQDFVSFLNKVIGMTFVHTYHGIAMWDDKYSDKDAEERLLNTLKGSLPELHDYVKGSDWVFLTCQPSDDMYNSSAVKQIWEEIEKEEYRSNLAVGWRRGYIMNCATKEVYDYDPETCPPFATIVFPTNIFLEPRSHYIYIGPYKSHEYVKDIFNYKELLGRGFMVGTHGENISTTFNHPYATRELEGDERDSILHKFSVYYSDRVYFPVGFRLLGRKAINTLPRPLHDIIKWAYHKLRGIYYERIR
uniref:Uncharacterized protein n=1 Tax=viral metagenome TaxID=1070528 RepID=A0A6H1ZEB9_9ZZZZ